MLEVAKRNNPARTRWIDRVCQAVRDDYELRRNFAITNMVVFRTFVRRRAFGEIRGAALVLEAGRIPALLYHWQGRQSGRKHSDEAPALPRPAKGSEQPDGQLHLLPFWAGVREFKF
ncbi:MAG: hypothetical protein HYT31_01800 [Parcubacteria group bacterium]|nr:hypothetical protein [Parcubacteria group bacterium]